jgi:3-oxoacyl-(acyl-carrier-protein) synthase
MRDNDAVITGLGVISAAGACLAANLASFKAGLRNAGPPSLFETSLRNPVFEVKGIPTGSYPDGQRTLYLARMAISEALDNAGIKDNLHRFRVGVCLGTTVASQLNDLDFYSAYRSTGSAPMGPIERYLKGNLAEAIARIFNASGPALTVVNACSSGTDAIGIALSFLRNDLCDIAIAGGADELSRIPLCGFSSLGIASGGLCAPFDRDRSGLNLGEGAGVIILEKNRQRRTGG